MFRIAIVEDQEETRECLSRFVRQYAAEQLLDPLAQSTTLWQQQLLLLVLYISFFALLGGMIYLCADIDKKGQCTARFGACSSRSAPTRAGAFWSCNLPGMDTR